MFRKCLVYLVSVTGALHIHGKVLFLVFLLICGCTMLPSWVSCLGSSLVRLLYPAEDRKKEVPLVLYPPLQVSSKVISIIIASYPPLQCPCILCDQGPLYRLHFHTSSMLEQQRSGKWQSKGVAGGRAHMGGDAKGQWKGKGYSQLWFQFRLWCPCTWSNSLSWMA